MDKFVIENVWNSAIQGRLSLPVEIEVLVFLPLSLEFVSRVANSRRKRRVVSSVRVAPQRDDVIITIETRSDMLIRFEDRNNRSSIFFNPPRRVPAAPSSYSFHRGREVREIIRPTMSPCARRVRARAPLPRVPMVARSNRLKAQNGTRYEGGNLALKSFQPVDASTMTNHPQLITKVARPPRRGSSVSIMQRFR